MLLQNAGFQSGLGGWITQGSAGFSSNVDADNCPGSGSAGLLTTSDKISQCVSVSGGSLYAFGFRFKGIAGSSGLCEVYFYADPACIDSNDIVGVNGAEATQDGTWQPASSSSLAAPANAASALVFCIGANATGYFDQIFFNSANQTQF